MKKFDFTTTYGTYLKSNCFRLFLGRIKNTKKTFQNQLTFSQQIVPNVLYGQPLFSHVFNRPCDLCFFCYIIEMADVLNNFQLDKRGAKKEISKLISCAAPF